MPLPDPAPAAGGTGDAGGAGGAGGTGGTGGTGGAEHQPSPAGQALAVIATLGSPLAVVAALSFYFGWRRSQAQAAVFGVDVSIFDMSAQDYVLRSIAAVFWPCFLLLLAGIGVSWLHRRLVSGPASPEPADPTPDPPTPDPPTPDPAAGPVPDLRPRWRRRLGVDRTTWAGRVVRLSLRSWAVFLTLAGFLLAGPGTTGELALPFLVGLAVAGPAYGVVLRRHLAGRPAVASRPAAAMVVALLLITVMWQVERYAAIGGTADAEAIKNDPTVLPSASVYSAKRLRIEAPGVTETQFTGTDDGYRYRYDGLHLLQRSGGRYFLISGDWQQNRGRLVILPDTDSIRLDFTGPVARTADR